jgi:hypothetical protein
VKKEPNEEKIASEEKASDRISFNNQKLSEEKTPFEPHPNDHQPLSSKNHQPRSVGDTVSQS